MTSVHVHYCTVVPTKPMYAKLKWIFGHLKSVKMSVCHILPFVFHDKMKSYKFRTKRGSENYQKWIFPLLPGMHIVHYTLYFHSFQWVILYSASFFITTLNTVWCWTKQCLNPWKTNLPRSCRMLTFKAAIKSHLDLFSKGISRWICMFLLWLWTLWEWFTSSILPCWDKTRPSPMMEWSVPALLSHTHTHTCTVCDSRQ